MTKMARVGLPLDQYKLHGSPALQITSWKHLPAAVIPSLPGLDAGNAS